MFGDLRRHPTSVDNQQLRDRVLRSRHKTSLTDLHLSV